MHACRTSLHQDAPASTSVRWHPAATVRRLLAVLAVALSGLLASAPGALAQRPDRIALPDGFQPEGVERAGGTGVFVGSLADGSIWRGDVRTGAGAIWAPGTGQPALGIARDVRRGVLWVAGGPSGELRAYDLRSAALVRTYRFPGAGFLNDVAVTRRAVFVTDSLVPQLAVVRLRGGRRLPSGGTTLPLSGDIRYVAGPPENPAFNANGIVAYRGRLIVAQSETGQLFAVDPRTGVAREIDTAGVDLRNADGLERRGSMLFVVRNDGVVERLRLGRRLRSARPAGTLAGELDYPSTAALIGGSLYVVNARFATEPTPSTPYWLTRLRVRGTGGAG